MPRAYFKSDDELFEVIQRCRTSGMTDKEWCKANGMSQTSFYRYIKRLKEKSYEIPAHFGYETHQVVPIQIVQDEQSSSSSVKSNKDVTIQHAVSTDQSGIHISCGNFLIDIDANSDLNTLRDTLIILQDIC